MDILSTLHVSIVTLGCSKNQVDSEFLAGSLKIGGISVSHEYDVDKTNVVIINTCGFILDAKEQSIHAILEAIEAKKRGEIQWVFAMGCLTQRYRDELQKELRELDGIFGVNDWESIVKRISGLLKYVRTHERVLTTPPHYAFLKISEGCSRSCAFCAIPGIRGSNISRTIESLVDESKYLVRKGVKELILIAQDLTYYGIDIYGKRMLSALLEQLETIEGIHWIRLHYAFPAQFPMEVLELMAKSNKICHYIDIPLQHVNTNMLKSMRRGIDGSESRKLIAKMKEIVPDLAIRTTLIAGFPGETQEMFEELCDFVQEMKFDRMGVFPYSHEEGTPAYVLDDDVPEEVKQERVSILMEIQETISLMHNSDKVGQEMTVIVDREEQDYYIGRTQYDSPEVDNEVYISKTQKIDEGDVRTVKITGADYFDLYASLL